MPTTVKAPNIIIPTGYEGLQQSAAAKRRLAEAMLGQGLQQDPNMSSWAQVLGHLAQTWAGKSLGKDADKLELDYGQKVGDADKTSHAQFSADANSMTPKQLIDKWGDNPYVAEDLKPYASAMESGLKEAQEHTMFGGQSGKWMRKGDIADGTYAPNDPNAAVIRGQDGSWIPNPVKITASIASQGIPVTNPTSSMQDPRMGGTVPQMPAGQPQAPAPQQQGIGDLTTDQASAAIQALGAPAAAAWLQRNPTVRIKVNTPDDVVRLHLPPGTKIVTPDGEEREVH